MRINSVCAWKWTARKQKTPRMVRAGRTKTEKQVKIMTRCETRLEHSLRQELRQQHPHSQTLKTDGTLQSLPAPTAAPEIQLQQRVNLEKTPISSQRAATVCCLFALLV